MEHKIFELSSLDGSNGFNIFGPDSYKGRNYSVSNAGDFNGDGIDDVLIGRAASNQSYIIFGAEGWSEGNISVSDLNGNNGVLINGVASNDSSGFSVAYAGDVNGDGIDDIIIGAPSADGWHFSHAAAGRSYVVFGSTSRTDQSFDLANIDGSNGFEIVSHYAFGAGGWSVAGAGDLNDDGISDIAIGIPGADANGEDSGIVAVVYGSSSRSDSLIKISDRWQSDQLILTGSYADAGHDISAAGDFNGDGVDDLIIGAPGAGRAYVVFGAPEDASIEVSDRFEFFAGNRTGYSVSSAGDFNGDGIDDIIVGSRVRGAGEVYVVFGSSSRVAQSLTRADLDGKEGFKILGVVNGDQVGTEVTSIGDINGDGIDDLIIGAYGAGAQWGQSYVVYGGTHWTEPEFDLSNLNSSLGYRIDGFDASTKSGSTLSTAGDFNNDGIIDIIVGTSKDGVNGTVSPEAYLVFGTISEQQSIIEGTLGDDLLNGTDAADTIYGLDGSDTLDGGAGDDILEGGDGDDTIDGGDGDDTILGGDGNDTIDDGLGSDTVDAGHGIDTYARNFDDDNPNQVWIPYIDLVEGGLFSPTFPGIKGDTLLNFENVSIGGSYDVIIRGDDNINILSSSSGDDVLTGGDGDDTLSAWIGNDEVYAGAGNDTIINTGGEDLFDGGDGVDTLITDLSQSVKDRLGLSLDFDIVFDLNAEDPHMRHYAVKPDGTDYAWDEIYSIENYTLIGDFDAELTGDDQANILVSDSGDDVLNGGAGDDTLYGGEGDDTYHYRYLGIDTVSDSGGDDDAIYITVRDINHVGFFGNSYVEDGDLILTSRQDATKSLTVKNAFEETGRIEKAIFHADSGAWDDLTYRIASLNDQFVGNDILYFGTRSDDTLVMNEGYNEAVLSDGDDTVYAGDGGSWIFAGEGNDRVVGGAGNDYIVTDYRYIEGSGTDLVESGAGNDTIVLDGNGVYNSGFAALNISSSLQTGTEESINLNGKTRFEDVMDGGADVDTVELTDASDAFFLHDSFSGFHSYVTLENDYGGRAGAARIDNIENINAGDGDDIVDLTSPDYSLAGQNITVNGGEGHDTIWGSDANEALNGDDGDDILFGGAGTNTLTGGTGADEFQFTKTSKEDTITDFNITEGDTLALFNTGGAAFDISSMILTGESLQINYSAEDSITVVIEGSNLTVEDLSDSIFVV